MATQPAADGAARPEPARPLAVAAFTSGAHEPCARFRLRQYLPALRGLGVRVADFGAPLGTFPPLGRAMRPLWAVGTLASRLPDVARSYRYDVTFLQREMLSTFATLESLTHGPRVFDVDDAIFAWRGGGAARRIVGSCALVICGNDYLAAWFGRYARQVAVLPTAIDTRRYVPAGAVQAPGRPSIGWIGSSANYRYLYAIEDALRAVLATHRDVVLRIMAERPPAFRTLPPDRVEFVPWSTTGEVAFIQQLSVGIMPLRDEPIARGKCAYKLLQYMACGLPVVASPVGMNALVLGQGAIGHAARSSREWADALGALLAAPETWSAHGSAGRAVVEATYSVDVVAPRLASLLQSVAA